MSLRARLVALSPFFLSACSNGAPPATYSVVDSSGVSVVTSAGQQWSVATAWSVDPAPLLSIREVDGQPATHLYIVTDGMLLDDGRILVADAGSAQIQLFGASGGHESTWGRRGEGPGEFEWIESVHRTEEGRIFAYDDNLGRGTFFELDGELHRTVNVFVPPGVPASDAGILSSGDLLGIRAGPTQGVGGHTPTGLVTSEVVVIRMTPDGTPGDTVAVAPGDELFLLGSQSGRPAGFRVPAFGLNRAVALHGDRVFTRAGRGPEIAEYDLDGRLLRMIRWHTADLTITPEELESGLHSLFGDDDGAVARYDLPVPETKPGFGRLVFDSEGYLWASEYAQYLQDPKMWFVFDTLGAYLGDVEVPDRFRVLHIKGDRILGRTKDEFDRETIDVLGLRRR